MIIVFGSTNLDQIGTVNRLPAPGETVAGGKFSVAPGGKGANQALAARRAGARVRHVSAVGRDGFADLALAQLVADGVDITGVRRLPGATGIAMIFVDRVGENVIAVLPGANAAMTAADADRALAGHTQAVVLLQQEIPQAATEQALHLARRQGLTTILNTAPLLATTSRIAPLATIIVANESEFAMLHCAHGMPLQAAMVDWAVFHGQTVIVTLGGAGARAATADGRYIAVAAPEIEPVDTVGAGDTFCGYLAAGLDEGLPLEYAVARAVTAASLACLIPGAQPSIPGRDQVKQHIRSWAEL